MARTHSIGRWLTPIRILVFVGPSLLAQSGGTYLPLFTIERSTNANVIHYEARIRGDGRLDPREPVIAYWIMTAEDGRRQALSSLEKTRAYGFTTRADGPSDSYKMYLVSDPRREIHIYRRGISVHAETLIGGRHAYLQRIFISTRKSLLFRTPISAELFGVEIGTGEPCYEKVQANH
jgi:Domain of unknown function (DUF4833)